MDIETTDLSGVPVSLVNLDRAVGAFYDMVLDGREGLVSVTSAHGVVYAQQDPRLRKIIQSAVLSLPDGAPLALVAKWRSGGSAARVPGVEFFSRVLDDPRSSCQRHFFYGGHPATLDVLMARVRENLHDDAIAGAYSPPMRPAGAREETAVIRRIRDSGANIVWVGLSTPKQEYWMANHRPLLAGVICVGIGAAFDFYAGTKHRAPDVMRRSGLEWVYRLLAEPKRLGPRYIHVVPVLLTILARESAADAWRLAQRVRRS